MLTVKNYYPYACNVLKNKVFQKRIELFNASRVYDLLAVKNLYAQELEACIGIFNGTCMAEMMQ